MVELITKTSDANEAQAKENVQLANTVLLIVLVVSLGIGVAGALAISRSITAPLDEAVKLAQVVALDDFSTRVESRFKDKRGILLTTLNNMSESLSLTLGKLRGSTEIITTASSEIASGNQDLSSRT